MEIEKLVDIWFVFGIWEFEMISGKTVTILKHPQPTFLPQCKQRSFTPTQNNRQNYSSVRLNLYIFG
jgi:hypothetical protein